MTDNYLNMKEIYTLLKLYELKEELLFKDSQYDLRKLRGTPKLRLDASMIKRKYRGVL